jgi:hypothetical protein
MSGGIEHNGNMSFSEGYIIPHNSKLECSDTSIIETHTLNTLVIIANSTLIW